MSWLLVVHGRDSIDTMEADTYHIKQWQHTQGLLEVVEINGTVRYLSPGMSFEIINRAGSPQQELFGER